MNINMTRHSGAIGLGVAECIDKRYDTWRVRADIRPDYDEESGEQRGVTFVETEFPYKPTLEEVKEFVLAVIDAQTDEAIISGFTYPDDNGEESLVWLSEENQRNYREEVDEAKETGENLPTLFKFGTTLEPKFRTFRTAEELVAFHKAVKAYIKQCYTEGWAKKYQSIDWSEYEQALNPVEP